MKDRIKYRLIKDIEVLQDSLCVWEYDKRELKNLGRIELRIIKDYYERLVNKL